MQLLPSVPGVYIIECTGNDKIYVGSGKNMRIRAWSHCDFLKKNSHFNSHLQRAFNKYGPETFKFYVLEEITCDSNRLAVEQYWIKALDTSNKKHGFNIALDTHAPMLGRKLSLKSRQLLSQSLKINARRGVDHPNFGKKLSKETCAKMSTSRSGNKNWAFGKKINPVLQKALIAFNTGRKQSQSQIEKRVSQFRGSKHWLWGGHHSPEIREKMSKNRKGKCIGAVWHKAHGTIKCV